MSLPLAPTLKPKTCRQCGTKFTPDRAFQRVCGHLCGMEFARAQPVEKKRKALAKVERAQDRETRASQQKLPKLLAEAQKEFNAFIRARDKQAGQPCVSCGNPLKWEVPGLRAHEVDAGHLRSIGSASHLRFDEDNCHAQCVWCNRDGAGKAIDYRTSLIKRIGMDRVNRLESDNEVHKWTREELRQIKVIYRGKLRDLLRQKD